MSDTVGPYLVGPLLPMSGIHVARDSTTGELYAIRIVDADDGPLPEEVDYIKVTHPNVTRVREVRRLGDRCYIAMELIRGVGLDDLVSSAGGPLPMSVACRIVADAASGVHALHTRTIDGKPAGRLHRGLRPHVFSVGADGTTRLAMAAPRTLSRSRLSVLTEALRYFAPEQSAGGAVDGRTDVFALGCILWELLTGEHIFAGRSLMETTMRVLKTKVRPPSRSVATIPAVLDEAVMHALALDKEDRTPSAGELAAEIEALGIAEGRDSVATFVAACTSDRLTAFDRAVVMMR